ncbi:MAG: methyltransferase domain-containing protein [Candidatus Kuenenia sp.]|nr:methyltransferase domain-containing protein [Candidatus Kuenenia hertensis]
MNMPKVYLKYFETLWFQITGTHCNLQCTHCFISCSSENNTLDVLGTDVIRRYLEESSKLGVKEYYFTGGEPFLHPEIAEILRESLNYGPTTVLTNGTLITQDVAQALARITHLSGHKLEFRVSLESYEEEGNDKIRGKGSFQKAVQGISFLVKAGFHPIITISDLPKHEGDAETMDEEFKLLSDSLGITRLRMKKLPLVLLGRCAELIRPYHKSERVTEKCLDNFPTDNLQCTTSRIVTSKGVFVCPLLVGDPNALMGMTLKESLSPYLMDSPVCYTCVSSGLTCKNEDVGVIKDDTVRKSVRAFYTNAAKQPQKELCCPTSYHPASVSHIPQKIIDISYGCSSPVSLAGIKPGERVLDLGSGGGVDCFIAAKMVEEKGRVIGIDMTDEMLATANSARESVARNLGYDNVRFVKGFLEEIPLTDECIDLVVSNCVINLSDRKENVFREIFRVLKSGGRFVISDIVSDKEVPLSMKQDKKLWSECISGAITEEEFFHITKSVGFYGVNIVSRYLYKEVNGSKFYSVTAKAYKYKKSKECVYTGQYAVYSGPFHSVTDDDGHTYPAGIPVEVCTDTAWKLSNHPYEGMFFISNTQNTDAKTSCGPKCC